MLEPKFTINLEYITAHDVEFFFLACVNRRLVSKRRPSEPSLVQTIQSYLNMPSRGCLKAKSQVSKFNSHDLNRFGVASDSGTIF